MDPLLDWPEIIALILLFAGFTLAFFSNTLPILYTTCFLTGLLFGKLWHKLKFTNRVQVFLALLGILFGLLIGSLHVSARLITLLVFAGVITGYWILEKGIITPT